MTVQNACNLAWGMAQLRHRPAPAFADRLQARLLAGLTASPAAIHPQNVGDMLQAIGTWRYAPAPGLLEASHAWMLAHTHLLVANHALAYLNGLAVLGELTQEIFLGFADELEALQGGHVSSAVALRTFVLAHCTRGDSNAEEVPEVSPFVRELTLAGQAACEEVLASSVAAVAAKPAVRSISVLLPPLGYVAIIAADDALRGDTPVTPVLPELLVRPRAAGGVDGEERPPEIGLQILAASSCFR